MNEAYILATLIKTGVKVAVTNCIITSRFATGAILVPITEPANKQLLIETVLVSNAAQMELSAFRSIPEGAVRLIAYNDYAGFKHVFTKDIPGDRLFEYLTEVVSVDNGVFMAPGYTARAMNYGRDFAQMAGCGPYEAIAAAISAMKSRVEAGLEQTKDLVINYKYPNPTPAPNPTASATADLQPTRQNIRIVGRRPGNMEPTMPVAKPPFVKKPVTSLENIPEWLVKAVEQVLAGKILPIETITSDVNKLLEFYPIIKDTFNQTYCLEIQYLYQHFKNTEISGTGLHTLTTRVRDYCTLKAIQDFINPDEEVYTQEFKNSLTSSYGPLNNLSTIELGFNPDSGVAAEIKLKLLSGIPVTVTATPFDEKELVNQMMSVLRKASEGDFEEEMKGIQNVFDRFYCDEINCFNNFILGVYYKYPELMKGYLLSDMVSALSFVCLTRLFGDKLNAVPKSYPVKIRVIYNNNTNAIKIYFDHTNPWLCGITNLNDWFAVHGECTMLELLDYISSVPGIKRRLVSGVDFTIVPAKTRPFKLVPAY